ncbi:MAG: hypothetical protein FJX65_15650 [Alphaproteobacteria bacterium]|nr:hypothetical protein [Alphaproteobacteria bacterium]
MWRRATLFSLLTVLAAWVAGPVVAAEGEKARDIHYVTAPPAPRAQLPEQAAAKSAGCITCHTRTDAFSMHRNPAVVLGCTDCHGGDASVKASSIEDAAARDRAHVQPRYPKTWHYPSSGNPERSYTLLNREAPEFIRFVNPSDLRVAREACGACHTNQIAAVERSLMSTGAMLWGGAAYNNGILPFKRYITGEAYTREGVPAAVVNPVPPDPRMEARGILPQLVPLPRWEVLPPGDVFRVFERGGRNIVTQFPEIANPNSVGRLQQLEEPGRPDIRQSNRGPATGLRIAVPVINIHKTRLNDPFLWFLGTNDQPGDYRSSGCSGCHVVYANDRDPRHSGPWAKYGHEGKTATVDPTIKPTEAGHPIEHAFTRAIPTSQCMVCHMHQPNVFVNSFLGYTMWDYEPEAPLMYPKEQRYLSADEEGKILDRNPEEAVLRGLWSDVDFLKRVWTDVNPKAQHTQFADYHGHGWNFRAIFKRDRKGNLLDADGRRVSNDDPDKFKKTVHMSSIHVDLGMHCVDCHFAQDSHGNGHIYGEVQAAIEIRCKDCHGTSDAYPSLRTSGPAAPPTGTDLALLRTQDGRRRFEWVGGANCGGPGHEPTCKLLQRSALYPDKEWEMSLVRDTVNPDRPEYNAKAARAKLVSKNTADQKWGPGVAREDRAHDDDRVECYTCHLSWTTSCAGCHLPIQANRLSERHHFEGGISRNYATYNPQVARDDMFHLGISGSVKGNTIAPIRSSSALVLSSQNINRERIYVNQPPVAASGYSSQAFAPHYPHTERKTETKTCTDCHLSQVGDNNAWMAQLLLHGTNFVNHMGPWAYVGAKGGVEGVRITEHDEPQAVVGSYLHKYAYPDWFRDHEKRGRLLPNDYSHSQRGNETGCVQQRGEYLFAAEGRDGMIAYDIASIANKGVADRILSGPFGPWGHNTRVKSRNATCVAIPTNQPINPLRNKGELMRTVNQEQPMHAIYTYAFITDAEEGLIVTDVTTLQDGEPRNNFLKRAVTWNENGVLTGARHITLAGAWAYIATPRGVVVLDLDDPLAPKLAATIDVPDARGTALQFRYLFVTGREGLSVVDVTQPSRPRVVPGATVPLKDARRVYIARGFAYVAAKSEGLAIIDVETAEKPKLYMNYTADGQIVDAHDVVVASTNASAFAYVADGTGGLRVIQLTSPDSQPNFYGFNPDPKPELIATRKTRWPALSLSKGLDRDRAVDETGHQIAVLGRLGARPFNLKEQQKLYLDARGNPWTVTDEVRQQDFLPRPGARRQADAAPRR